MIARKLFDLRGTGTFAQLVRFAMVGGVSNVAYFVLFVTFSHEGLMTANLVGAAGSTALANELHRRVTFGAGGRIGWLTAQSQGGGLALVGLAVSSAAVAGFGHLFPATTALASGAFVVAVSAAIGGVRFLVLRGWFGGAQQAQPANGWAVPNLAPAAG
ncbi:GtrA family protein [Antrihabitans sp. YC2-6]|uniref:GtrA family protein n=1 Tax=Antrihabitans sp. YC2-6 TaxID=2799498 RepID=UPI0018F64174|nr:GtrA family protein [Antrihabitans sp. YC2-6]MBJ8345524.1 GtrA family protein [Antrihabitans sp. YC2-6]